MGTAVNDLVTLVRATIPELNAVEWTNARLITYLDREYQDWAAELGKLPGPGWFTMVSDFSIAANATTKDLSTLLNASTVGKVAALKDLWYVPTQGRRIWIETASPGQEELWVLPVGQTAVGQQAPQRKWLTRPAGVLTLNIGPVSSESRDFRSHLRYAPPTLIAGESAQTDPRHDDVLVLGAALRALMDTSETDATLEARYNRLRGKFLEDERLAAGENESETVKVVVSEEMWN